MKHFNYEARDLQNNNILKATVQADSEDAAAKLLIGQGLSPISIKEEGDKGGLFANLVGRITTQDRIVFSRQLATLIGAGLPLAESLHTVLDQTQNKKMQDVIQEITSSVEGGETLSKSFAKFPQVFDKVYIALVAAGEASGTLDDALKQIADQQEKNNQTVSKIRGAFVYPIIVLVVIILVLGFMLFTVVPQVQKLYKDLHKDLPFLTMILVNVSVFMQKFWWVILIAIVVIVYLIIQYFKTDNGRKTKDTLKLNLPFFGKMFQKLYIARLARTGQTLLSSGVTMLDMLRISSSAVNNVIIENSVNQAAEKVRGGKSLSSALASQEYILPLLPQMIRVGEQSGKIDEMLGRTAKAYEDQLDEQVKNISTSIEPILMIILALVAAFIVGAVLFPIYNLVSSLTV